MRKARERENRGEETYRCYEMMSPCVQTPFSSDRDTCRSLSFEAVVIVNGTVWSKQRETHEIVQKSVFFSVAITRQSTEGWAAGFLSFFLCRFSFSLLFFASLFLSSFFPSLLPLSLFLLFCVFLPFLFCDPALRQRFLLPLLRLFPKLCHAFILRKRKSFVLLQTVRKHWRSNWSLVRLKCLVSNWNSVMCTTFRIVISASLHGTEPI